MSDRIIKTKALIFGTNDYAQVMHRYLTTDSRYRPVAWVVTDQKFKTVNELIGLPVITCGEAIFDYPPDEHSLFVPVRDNSFRRFIHEGFRQYGQPGYISSKALISGSVGENCFVQEFNNIQPFASVGNNCILWAGNHIGHHSIIEDDVTITSHCVISGHCRIGQGAYLGVNCTIRDGVTIGAGAVIGMGAVVIRDVEPGGKVVGNPAKPLQPESPEEHHRKHFPK